jgi:hypothetical protein
MNNSSLFLSIIVAIIVGQSYSLYKINNSSEIVPTTSDDDIYKCVSYTAAHIDISHSINEDFSQYKDCQTPGLYTLNRRDQRFKVDLDIQRQWIIQVSFNQYYLECKKILFLLGISDYIQRYKPTNLWYEFFRLFSSTNRWLCKEW